MRWLSSSTVREALDKGRHRKRSGGVHHDLTLVGPQLSHLSSACIFATITSWMEVCVGNLGDARHWWNGGILQCDSVTEMHEYQHLGEVGYMMEKRQQALAFIEGNFGNFCAPVAASNRLYVDGVREHEPRVSARRANGSREHCFSHISHPALARRFAEGFPPSVGVLLKSVLPDSPRPGAIATPWSHCL